MKELIEEVEKIPFFPFTNDYVFTKVLTNKPELAEHLIYLVTGKKETVVTINQQEVKNPKISSKASRYDVFIVTSKKEMYDLEMQKKNERNLAKRSRYYLSVNDVDVLKRRDENNEEQTYNDLPYSNIIFFCTFDPFHSKAQKYVAKERLFIYDKGSIMDVTNKGEYHPDYEKTFINISDDVEIYNIEDKDFQNVISYMKISKVSDDFTKQLDSEVVEVNRTDRGALMTRELELIETRLEGRQEGRHEGIQEGKQEERDENLKNTIYALKDSGSSFEMTLNFIQKIDSYSNYSNDLIKRIYEQV